jgi:hypothetical protein
MNALQVELGVAVRRDPKVLRRVSRILIIEGLHFATILHFRVEARSLTLRLIYI